MLTDPALSGLPAFLTPEPGLNSGFMLPQIAAAALVAENKRHAVPAVTDSIPTSANQEDHVSMATDAARRLLPMATNVGYIVGTELLAAAQGCDFHRPLASSPPLERARAALRALVPSLHDDRLMAPDVEAATGLVRGGCGRRGGRCRPPALHRPGGRMTAWLEVRRGEAPLVLSLPHTGTDIPAPSSGGSPRPGSRARTRTGASTGSTSSPRELDATTVRTRLSRTVIDVNRDPSGASLYPGRATTELCPTTTFDGDALYRLGEQPDAAEVERRRAAYFDPYHQALAAELAACAPPTRA